MIKQECIGIPDVILFLMKDKSRNNCVPRRGLFLVDAFSLQEKSPTITVGSFFSLQSHSEWSTFLTILTILQFLGVGKNFRLLMQSCCFFVFFLPTFS